MARTIELLLTENVENLGIVGDIVKVRPGHARNFLLPHGFAEVPTQGKIDALQERRAAALAEMQALRSAREELLARMEEVDISIVRACNDQGVLYGSVTQRDIADALQEAGYDVGTRSIRLTQAYRRVGEYHVPIQFDKDLRTEISLHIKPDRSLEDEMDDMEFDDEGNLVEKPAQQAAAPAEAAASAAPTTVTPDAPAPPAPAEP